MDTAAIAMTLLAARANVQQASLGAILERMGANDASSMANVVSQVAQNGISLANVAAGTGANLNLSV
jgi:transcriptional regulatory protein LevR